MKFLLLLFIITSIFKYVIPTTTETSLELWAGIMLRIYGGLTRGKHPPKKYSPNPHEFQALRG